MQEKRDSAKDLDIEKDDQKIISRRDAMKRIALSAGGLGMFVLFPTWDGARAGADQNDRTIIAYYSYYAGGGGYYSHYNSSYYSYSSHYYSYYSSYYNSYSSYTSSYTSNYYSLAAYNSHSSYNSYSDYSSNYSSTAYKSYSDDDGYE